MSAHRESPLERLVRVYRRHRLPTLAALAMATILITGFGAWWTSDRLARASQIAAHRAAATVFAERGDAPSLEEARRRLDLLLELAPRDDDARRQLREVEDRLRARREADLLAAARPDAITVLAALAERLLATVGVPAPRVRARPAPAR